MTKRIQGWEGRWLSKGGKEILIKSVAQTLPSYAMNVFLMSLEITKDIERTLPNIGGTRVQSNSQVYTG